MATSESPAVIRIERHWRWNPIAWSWFAHSFSVTTTHKGLPVIGTVWMRQRGPLYETKVTFP